MDLGQSGTAKGKGDFDVNFRADLMSFGVDVEGMNAFGLFQTKNKRFRIGGVEGRIMLALQQEKTKTFSHVFGIGAKVNGLQLNFAPEKPAAEEEDPPSTGGDPEDDVFAAMQELFTEPQPEPRPQRTRMRMSKKDDDEAKLGFGLSVGYMTPTAPGDNTGTFDVQLYDSTGKRGGMIHIPIDRSILGDKVYIKNVGLAVKKVEVQKATLQIAVSGGLKFFGIEMGVIDAGVSIPVTHASKWYPFVNGVDWSLKRESSSSRACS